MSAARTIEWNSVRARLEERAAALDRIERPDCDRIEAVYRERAARLATRQRDLVHRGDEMPVLLFRVGAERYAIALKELSDVCPMGAVMPLPDSPDWLIGVMNVSGELSSIVDLAALLEVPVEAPVAGGRVLVLRRMDGAIGLHVAEVETTCGLGAADFAADHTIDSGLIGAVTRNGVGLVDVNALVAHLGSALPDGGHEENEGAEE